MMAADFMVSHPKHPVAVLTVEQLTQPALPTAFPSGAALR